MGNMVLAAHVYKILLFSNFKLRSLSDELDWVSSAYVPATEHFSQSFKSDTLLQILEVK